MRLENLSALYIEQLSDLYNAEQQLLDALPQMAEKSSHRELREAFESHLEETRRQHERLQRIFNNLGEKAGGVVCQAMSGLIDEGEELLERDADDSVRDAGLIAAAQRVEHYEIAAYGTVRTYAEMLGRSEDVRMLEESLSEEKRTDEKLNKIALQIVNPDAVKEGEEVVV